MILSFSKTFPWDQPTNFEQKILDGTKIHTIRKDPHRRWKEGNKVHCATGVRTKNYNCFYEGVCAGVQYIWIQPKEKLVFLSVPSTTKYIGMMWVTLPPSKVAENDGFDTTDDFFKWFNEPFKGRLIHWTDFKY